MGKLAALAATAAATLALGATVAVAAPAEHSWWPVEFTLTGGDPAAPTGGVCYQLEEGLTVWGKGSAHLIVNRSGFGAALIINGTAEDSEGGTYVFNYHAAFSAVKAGTELVLTDHFRLVGNGAANQVRTFFVAKVTFSESGYAVDADPLRGDPLWNMQILLDGENPDNVRCDPI